MKTLKTLKTLLPVLGLTLPLLPLFAPAVRAELLEERAPDAGIEKGPMPAGAPVVQQMPELCQWTIDIAYTELPKPENAASETSRASDSIVRPLHIAVTKTGMIEHEERTLEKNLTEDIWTVGTMMVKKTPNSPGLLSYSVSGLDNPFPELGWASPETFVGYQTGNGKKCLLFKQDRYTDEHAFIGTAYCLVDFETRYPVSYQFATETRRYTFLPPPTATLVPPPEFVAAGTALKEKIQRATPHFDAP